MANIKTLEEALQTLICESLWKDNNFDYDDDEGSSRHSQGHSNREQGCLELKYSHEADIHPE